MTGNQCRNGPGQAQYGKEKQNWPNDREQSYQDHGDREGSHRPNLHPYGEMLTQFPAQSLTMLSAAGFERYTLGWNRERLLLAADSIGQGNEVGDTLPKTFRSRGERRRLRACRRAAY